jgi:hypothetical protein
MRLVIAGSLFFAAIAAGAGAAEQSTAASTAARSGDALKSAQRDFELLKAARDPAMQGKDTLPKISAPDFTSPIESRPRLPQKSEKEALLEKQKKSANWLLDAMEKQADSGKSRGSGTDSLSLAAERDRERDGLTAEPQGEALKGEAKADRAADRDDAARDEKERPRTEPAFNPLARFMSEWMTPQDFALLKPVVDAPRGGESASAGPVAAPGASSEFTRPTAGDTTLGLIGSNKSFTPATPQENPYLQALNLPAPTATMTPPVSMPPSMPTASQPALAPLPSPITPKSKVPDFVKPAQDEKHFKQLKRF